MATKKISKEQLEGNVDVISDLMREDSPKPAEKKPVEKEDPLVHVTIRVKESTRKQWKLFFDEHGISTTLGFEIAMLHLQSDVESGNYLLGKGGLAKVYKNED